MMANTGGKMKIKLGKPNLKAVGKQVGRAAAGAGVALSLLIGSLFGSPAELAEERNIGAASPPAIVQTVQVDNAYEPFTMEEEPAAEEKRTFRDKLRQLIMRMPVWLRVTLLMPCWAVGFAFMQAVTLLGTLLKIPILGWALRLLIGAGLVFCLIILAQKLLFPEIPLKKVLSRKNVIPLAAACAVMGAAGILGDILWRDKRWITFIIQASSALLYTGWFALFVGREKRIMRNA